MVSIYTLRKERDLEETLSFTLTPQFQSTRSARSATIRASFADGKTAGFQSTRSARSATEIDMWHLIPEKFQSTRSARSATTVRAAFFNHGLFQSTRSARSAT